MSSLSHTSRRRRNVSQAPRAKLTISLDAERDGAIPLAELAGIASSVQETVNQIVRSLNSRSGAGRSTDLLKSLSFLEAVGIEKGSAILTIEAPHDMEQFSIEYDANDSGVQAVELFVESLAALGEGHAPPGKIGKPATKSLGHFVRSVRSHKRVRVESTVAGTVKTSEFVPDLVAAPPRVLVEPPTSEDAVELVGTLYGADVRRHQYRIEDDQGHTRYLSVPADVDDVTIVRTLLGEPVRVRAVSDPVEAGPDHFVAKSIVGAKPRYMDEYYSWDLETALAGVEPIKSLDDLAIPGLDGEEFEAFWAAVNE